MSTKAPCSKMMKFDVQQIFKIHDILRKYDANTVVNLGEELIESLSKNNLLSTADRQLVNQRCALELVSGYGYTPSSALKENMAICIGKQLYSNCSVESQKSLANAFYRRCFGYQEGGETKYKPARGYLEDRIAYMRRNKKNGAIEKTAEASEKTSKQQIEQLNLEKVSDEDFREKSLWLRNHRNPEETLLNFMKDLFPRRRKEILSVSNGITSASATASFMANWPRLFENVACIDQDFRLIFPGKCNSLFEKWPTFSRKLIKLGQTSMKSCTKGFDVDWSVMNSNDDHQSDGSLFLLPYLFRAKTGGKSVTKSITPLESSLRFIRVCKTLEEMNEMLSDLEKTSTRPFVIVIGEKTTLEFSSFFIYQNGHVLRATTLLQAVSTALKSFFVFNIKFPLEAYDVWSFFDSVVFELNQNRLNSTANLLVANLHALP